MVTYDENQEQLIYPVTVIRGGTSRALFFRTDDLPGPREGQPALLAAAMGRPDPQEVDGLGGGMFNTSKVAIVGPSRREGIDLEYTFVQVEPDADTVDYNANCGNISSGVPVFALEEGMIALPDGEREVSILNTNTDKVLYARLSVRNGRALVDGDYAVPGIPGTGAKIFLDFRETVGAITGRMFPTGRPRDVLELEDGSAVTVTVCDVSNPLVFVDGALLGVTGRESLGELGENRPLLERCAEIRGRAAVLAGLTDDWRRAKASFIPPVCLVCPPVAYTASDGSRVAAEQCCLVGRLMVADVVHPTFMGTGSCCFAAAAETPGTVPHALLGGAAAAPCFRLGHPGGVMELEVEAAGPDGAGGMRFARLGFGRTARKIADGRVFVSRRTLAALQPAVIWPKFPVGLEV